MKMDVDHQRRFVTVWLPGDEQSAMLEGLYQRCRSANYRVAVFRSGKHELADCTAGLLRHNRG